jgi:hypothetical protein
MPRTTTPPRLRDRILDLRRIPARDLQDHQMNWRTHPQAQQDAMRSVLDELGIAAALLVYDSPRQGGLCIIDGHLRKSLDPAQEWPCLLLDLDDDEAAYLLATHDPLGAMAEASRTALARLLEDVHSGQAAVQQLLSDLASDAGLYTALGATAPVGTAPALPTVSLAERFLVPPFSVLDARQGYWQARKRAWLALGIQSELGRGEGVTWGDSPAMIDASLNHYRKQNGLLGFSQQARSHYAAPGGSLRDATTLGTDGHTVRGNGVGKPLARTEDSGAPGELAAAYKVQRLTWPHDTRPEADLDDTSRKILAAGRHTAATAALMDLAGGFSASHQSGTSIFDPVLCELAYRWFCPPAGAVLDPFAGGSVRGIVAARLGRAYTGIDLRPEQVAANQAQWTTIGGGSTPTPLRPVPRVEDCDGFRIVRDDETPGGSKVRALLAVLPALDAAEYVYASPAAGFAQIALALAARTLRVRATIFTAARTTLHPCSAAAQQAGAHLEQIPHGYLSHVQAKARAYCDATGAVLLPFGLDDPAYITALAAVARETGEDPQEVWCVAGSGVLARALRQAWPTAHLCVVVIGKEPLLPADNVTVYRAPEAFETPAQQPPPFASCAHYDAKAWRFMQAHARPGALFWNVAGDATPEAVPLATAAPIWLVGDSRDLDTLLPPETHYDLVFTCPPYADLERYSDDPRDLSTLPYADFLAAYRQMLAASVARLRDDRFAALVVGDVRDSEGYYRNFVSDTIAAMQDAGARLYNEAILVTAVGSLPLRAGIPFTTTRKLGKTHQQVLVFVKGDPRRATNACGPVAVEDALQAVSATGEEG